ncbi:hypothetical protein PIB30_064184 [Stylosanthes scabra]|uniref:Uncharacterized protein n=1 Tax=Stylosanthes scabra TaxID=79078 RepID=A0ABU6QMC7_9FABA|nr:hypothetical protein [Stylosanthes scabra]
MGKALNAQDEEVRRYQIALSNPTGGRKFFKLFPIRQDSHLSSRDARENKINYVKGKTNIRKCSFDEAPLKALLASHGVDHLLGNNDVVITLSTWHKTALSKGNQFFHNLLDTIGNYFSDHFVRNITKTNGLHLSKIGSQISFRDKSNQSFIILINLLMIIKNQLDKRTKVSPNTIPLTLVENGQETISAEKFLSLQCAK